jgi:hypothetical protein
MVLAFTGCGRVGFDATGVFGDGGGSGTTDGRSDGGMATHCGGPLAISDNFDDGVVGTDWYTFTDLGVTLGEVGGHLVVGLVSNGLGSAYGGYIGARFVDFRGQRTYVEVPQVPNTALVGEAALQIFSDNLNNISITERQGMLRATLQNESSVIAMVPYDPVAHRWWQLREAAGTIYFETSPDGVTYTAFSTTPAPAWVSHAKLELFGGSYTSINAPGQAHFDNLNGGGTPMEPWCKASSFVDDFSAGAIGPEWGRVFMNGACTNREMAGQAVITLDGAASNVCGLVSGTDFDLVGDGVFVKVNATPNVAVDAYSYVMVKIDDGAEYFELEENLGDTVCAEYISGVRTERCHVLYDAAQLYWRVREENGDIVWERGSDGVTWNQLGRQPEPYPFTDVQIEIGAGAMGATGNPGTATFDAYNE